MLSQLVKEKYGSDVDENEDEEDSEEAESEDEDGEELTPAMDAAILRTLARIKRKDPSIYESSKDVFEGALFAYASCTGMRGSLVPIPEERQKTGELVLGRAQKDKVCPRTFTRANAPNIPQAQLVYLVVMLVETSHHPATRPCVRPRRGVWVAHTLSRTAHTRPGTTQAPG